MFNQLMVLPNAIALIALSGLVVSSARGKDKNKEERLETVQKAEYN